MPELTVDLAGKGNHCDRGRGAVSGRGVPWPWPAVVPHLRSTTSNHRRWSASSVVCVRWVCR